MYQLQEIPDKEIALTSGGKMTPLATLKDECGGIAHICNDDHCYVLYIKVSAYKDREVFYSATHWFREAVAALQKMPLPK